MYYSNSFLIIQLYLYFLSIVLSFSLFSFIITSKIIIYRLFQDYLSCSIDNALLIGIRFELSYLSPHEADFTTFLVIILNLLSLKQKNFPISPFFLQYLDFKVLTIIIFYFGLMELLPQDYFIVDSMLQEQLKDFMDYQYLV